MPRGQAWTSRQRWRLAAVAWAAIICAGLFLPGAESPRGLPYGDKAAHFGIFMVLGALIVRGWPASGEGRGRFLWAIAAAAVLAALTELGQAALDAVWSLGRTGEIGDGVADVVGAAVGALTAPKR